MDVTFGLSADVNRDDLIITYSMSPPEPVPTGCTAWGTGADRLPVQGRASSVGRFVPDQPHAVNWVVCNKTIAGFGPPPRRTPSAFKTVTT